MSKIKSITKKCVECGKGYHPQNSNDGKRQRFCSQSCFASYRRGKSNLSLRGRKFPERCGEKHHGWKGGRYIDGAGYIRVYRPDHHRASQNGYVPEHILVMEEELGRKIGKNESIHHVDENKSNNSISNLRLMSSYEHKSFHAKKRWAEGTLGSNTSSKAPSR